MKKFIQKWRVGFFLAVSQLKRASKATTTLVIFVMLLTFLNLVVTSGILVGLIEGSSVAYRDKYIGDVYISPLDKKTEVLNSHQIEETLKTLPEVFSFSSRISASGAVESNASKRLSDDLKESANARLIGIDADAERATTKLNENIIEGSYLDKEDGGQYVLIASGLLNKYSRVSDVAKFLGDVKPGDTVRITFSAKKAAPAATNSTPADASIKNVETTSITRDYFVKGIVKLKVGDLSQAVFMDKGELQKMIGKSDVNVEGIAVRGTRGTEPQEIKDTLLKNNFDSYAKVQTFTEGEPEFVKQMKDLFGVLGTFFGSIGIIVAAITIFIIIFINAITRRKYIGILKGIGIDEGAIEIAYVLQSIFYALIGSALGFAVTFLVLKPFFVAHPIDFPFSDGILVATVGGTAYKMLILIVVTLLAGYIPARMIVKQNTLDAILGRNSTKAKKQSK